MISHAPQEYPCPFCSIYRGESSITKEEHIVFRGGNAGVFMSLHFTPTNRGHALVVPFDHVENIYELGEKAGSEVLALARNTARAMKFAYGCDGVTLIQNNEPSGGQDVWHFHLHVMPRYTGDGFHQNIAQRLFFPADSGERAKYAAKLRQVWGADGEV